MTISLSPLALALMPFESLAKDETETFLAFLRQEVEFDESERQFLYQFFLALKSSEEYFDYQKILGFFKKYKAGAYDVSCLEKSSLLDYIDRAYVTLMMYWLNLQWMVANDELPKKNQDLVDILEVGMDASILLTESVNVVRNKLEVETPRKSALIQFVEKVLTPVAHYLALFVKMPYENTGLRDQELVNLAFSVFEAYQMHEKQVVDREWVYIKKNKQVKSCRSFFVNLKSRDVIILSKTKKGVPRIGDGTYKKVSEALSISYAKNWIEILAQSTLKQQYVEDKTYENVLISPYQNHLNQIPYLAPVLHCFCYTSQNKGGKDVQKMTAFQKKCVLDLFDLLDFSSRKLLANKGLPELTFVRQVQVVEKLALALFSLHHYEHTTGSQEKIIGGFVHSDIKVENILLDIDAKGNYIPSLTDFDTLVPVSRVHFTKKTVGTYSFFSPELLLQIGQKRSQVHEKSLGKGRDVYAMGLVFYMVMTQRAVPWSHYISTNNFSGAVKRQNQLKERLDTLEKEIQKQNEPLRALAHLIARLIHHMLHPQLELRLGAGDVLKEMQKIGAEVRALEGKKVDFYPVSCRIRNYLP